MKKIALAIAFILSLNVSNVWAEGNNTNSSTRTIKAPRFARPLVEKWISEYAKVEPGIRFVIAKGAQNREHRPECRIRQSRDQHKRL